MTYLSVLKLSVELPHMNLTVHILPHGKPYMRARPPLSMDIIELTQELIRIESHTDGRPIVNYVSTLLKNLGAHISLYGTQENPALLAEFGKGGIVFSGHLDTVVMGEWDYHQGEMVGSRLYGRGSADMKSGCAAMIAAARILKDKVPFSVAFTTDEEVTMHGAEELARTDALKTARAIVVGEPTGLKAGLGEKGTLWLTAETRGKSSHGSMPWMGDNAILKMVRHLKDISPYTEKEGITINLGILKGGTQINVTPDHCTAQLDVRYPPSRTKEEVIAYIEDITGLPLSVEYELPPVTLDRSAREVQALVALTHDVCTCYYATEAVKFFHNAPTIIVGPGEQEMAHQKNEYVEISQIEKAVEIYTKYALSLNY